MDARERLRRYLQQRRDAGETELVLDQLSVDDALRLIGSRATSTPTPRGGTPPEPAPESPRPRSGDASGGSSDWRALLREQGVAPGRANAAMSPGDQPPRGASPEPPAPPRDERSAGARPSAAADFAGDALVAPPGLVVGRAGAALPAVMAHLDSLAAVAEAVAACTRCPLYATAKNPVPGVGNPTADLMIVGEAPGANEDEQGEPFVGAAGQLLTKILAAVELRRDDVYICNVLKHRPPGNRNPMPDEVTACSPYLFRQFELIRPKVILALGTFAAQTLLETKLGIGKLRSQVHRFHGVPLIVTYHPAALLRNPSWKRPTWEDVQLVRRILDSAAPLAES